MGKCALINGECPRTSDPKAKRFCPAWEETGVVWRNIQTGEEKVFNCAFSVMMKSIAAQVEIANGVQAAVESNRNEVANGFGRVTEAIRIKQLGHG
jgi:hypothetical protein